MKKLINNWPIFILILLSLTPLLWFLGKGGYLINGIDTNFPINPVIWFSRRFYVWNSTLNAGIDFSSSTAGIFFHLIQVIPFVAGFNLQVVQLTSLIFWFALIVASSFIFAKVFFRKHPLSQIIFVIFYSLNIYMFNSWENVKVANLSLMGSIPLALSLFILLGEKRIARFQAVLFSAIIGVILSGSGINPSYFISFFMVISIYLLGKILIGFSLEKSVESVKDFVLVTSVIVMINSFWILPSASYISKNISPSESINKIGFTNWVDSLSEHTSLLNVARMQGLWDWYAFDTVTGQPLFIPYALNYFNRLPFIVFSLLIPALAIISLIFPDKRKISIYASFALMMTVGIFMGAGTHEPTGALFRFLLQKIPFFSLFRSPWYIFTPLVVISYAGLVGLLFSRFKLNAFLWIAGIILIVGNLLYSYPLITGKIFRPTRQDGFYVRFPDYVFEAGKWLEEGSSGRIIGYPDDEIEQFSWGYRGIESILSLFSNKEIMFSPLNDPNSPVTLLIKEFYNSLKKRQLDSAYSLARRLGINTIFEKEDQPSLAKPLPEEIKNLPKTTFGEWNFYELSKENMNKIFITKDLLFGYPYNLGQKILPAMAPDEVLINPADTVVKSAQEIPLSAGQIVLSENSQSRDLLVFSGSASQLGNRVFLKRDLSFVNFNFEIPSEGEYQPILENYKLEGFGINPNESLEIDLDGARRLWEIDYVSDSHVYFKKIGLAKGLHQISLPLSENNLVGKDFLQEGDGRFEIISENNDSYLSIFNRDKRDISAYFEISAFDPLATYLIEIDYKQIYGNNAAVLVGQKRKDTLIKTQVERLPNHPEWNRFSFYYEPVKTESYMYISLVAPQTPDPLGTKVFFKNLSVRKIFTNNLIFAKRGQTTLANPQMSFKKISPVFYEGSVTNVGGPHVITFLENYSPDWEMRIDSYNPNHFSSNMYANSWYVNGIDGDYKFKIYYKPQKLFDFGLLISGITASAALLLFAKGYLHAKRNK